MSFGLTGRFFGQLALLIRQGIPMVPALELIARDLPDPSWTAAVLRTRDRIAAGGWLSTSLEEFPPAFPRELIPFVVQAEQEGVLDLESAVFAAWPDAGATSLDGCLARALAEASLRLRRGTTILDAFRAARRAHDAEPLGPALEALGKTVFGPETPDEVMARFPAVFGPAARTLLHAAFQKGNVETTFAELAVAISRGWFGAAGTAGRPEA